MEIVRIKQATKQGFAECVIGGVADFNYPSSKTRRARVQGGGNISPTITSERSEVCKVETEYRIRKLTPRECWRLMDQRDEDFNKAAEVNSNTQLYKQAGNSIVVNVLVAILGQLFDGKEDVYKEILDKEQPYL
jgi:DNA (cytosine-5)-methyltransferase 1